MAYIVPRIASAAGMILGLIACELCLGLISSPAFSHSSQQSQKILILDSSHPSMPWSQEFLKGFSSSLKASKTPYILYKEFMDLARFPGEQRFKNFAEFISNKYADVPLDAIVSRGSPASQLLSGEVGLLTDAKRLYVNPAPSIAKMNAENLRGGLVMARADVVSGLRSAISLYQPRHVLVVGETQTLVAKRSIEALQHEYPGSRLDVEINFLLDRPLEEILNVVSKLPSDTLVFYSLIFNNGSGGKTTPAEAARQVASHASVPVFSHWDSLLGTGIVGGYMLSASKVGRIAALKLREILGDKEVATDSATETGFEFMFDARALARFDISTKKLPKGSLVKFETTSLWQDHRQIIIAVLFVALLIVLLSSLWINFLKKAVAARTADIQATNETLLFVTEQGLLGQGKNFFDNLAQHLAKTLGVDYAFVSMVIGDHKKAQTVGLCAMGEFPGNMEYELAYTPCDNVFGKELCCYPQNVQALYPKDELLEEMGAESYAAVPLWDSKSVPIGLVAVIHRKPLENIDRIKSVLRMVAMRAAQELEHHIIEEDLRTAHHEAEIANVAKSEFLANMSHELRTPLNSIIGFAEMMELQIKGPLPENYKEYTQLISNSGRLLLETINGILDLAKIEAGKFELNREETFMGDVIDEAVSLLNVQATKKGLEIVNQTGDLHNIRVDFIRIKQVLINIIGNAIKFTDHGTITIKSSCDENGHNIIISDTGIGMEPEQVEIALEPFSQVEGTSLSRRYQGSGLGLSISKNIMELHGGKLSVETQPDCGTTVTLHFPQWSSVPFKKEESA